MNGKVIRGGVLLLLLLASAGTAAAHPHIWIDSLFLPAFRGQMLSELRIEWYFDELYSSSYLIDFDLNNDRNFQASEVRDIYENAFYHLRNTDYFMYISHNGQAVAVPEAVDFSAAYENGRVVYRFTLPLNQSVASGDELLVTSFDLTNFIDFYVPDLEASRPARPGQPVLRVGSSNFRTRQNLGFEARALSIRRE